MHSAAALAVLAPAQEEDLAMQILSHLRILNGLRWMMSSL